jgi:two-component system, NarL family, response regulator
MANIDSRRGLIAVMIAEDHLIARIGMATIVNAQRGMRVIAEATSGLEAVAMYREYKPDVVLMDIRMPRMDGLEATRRIRAEFGDARILAISTFAGDYVISAALTAGASGYVNKDVLNEDLVSAIRSAHSGQQYLPSGIAATLALKSQAPNLTSREVDVLSLIVEGLSNKQIGSTLGIVDYTVKNHVRSILAKMGASDRTHAAILAVKRGLVHIL